MLCLMVGFGLWFGSEGERSGGGDFFVVSRPFWFWDKKNRRSVLNVYQKVYKIVASSIFFKISSCNKDNISKILTYRDW